jgi:hypothetical protein
MPRPLAADVHDGWGLKPLAKLGLRGVDDALGQGSGADPGQDLVLDRVRWAAPGLATQVGQRPRRGRGPG